MDTRTSVRLLIARGFGLARTARHETMRAQINTALLTLLDLEERLGHHRPEEIPRRLEPGFERELRRLWKRLDNIDIELTRRGTGAKWIGPVLAVKSAEPIRKSHAG
jgi:hypothetical protein